MDWDRNRRFDDHRGGESYRPAGPRGYIRRSRSPRNRSPRLVADTWVPSSSRSYNRMRSRSPPAFRGRSSRSPSFYSRDTVPVSYIKACSPPRRFSPRREGRPRSPLPTSWRPRSPYGETRGRDFSRDRNTPKRSRDRSPPNQDFRSSRRERPALATGDQYIRPNSPSRRNFLRDNLSRVPMIPQSRSPNQDNRRGRHTEGYVMQRRRSPSPRCAPSVYTSAPGSISNSRRSSPFTDRVNIVHNNSRNQSPSSHSIPYRRLSKNAGSSPSRAFFTKSKLGQDEPRHEPQSVDQAGSTLGRGPDVEHSAGRTLEIQDHAVSQSNTIPTGCVPSHPRAYISAQRQSPPSGPSHGPRSLTSQQRSSSISLLSAPTRPRGGPSFKDNIWSGAPARRGPISAGHHAPPTGPRTSHLPTAPGAEIHRHPYRQSSVTGSLYPRTPKFMNHLTGLSPIVTGGRLLPSKLDSLAEKRISQLDADKDRLLEQIADSQKSKRSGVRDWDRLDRESSICALKSELAEGHLQRLTDGESTHVSAIF
ncbi:hypothetical protein BDV25DRAFT_159293 [Aspergillus avenaceus]|uniref:Serine/arginine repetitive matrix protein 1 n=1 Tax=Aspergillus avenaceus TaxID=36643 RepID=A0A5N6TNR3_ASPAV|nr:hypothetical protein BDV25DRAFT_159293 [Aspergillus avenaceus]